MKSIFKLFALALSFLTPGAWCASASGMALIKLTAVVDSISGSVRGTVFARNKGGAYIRGKGVVSNPQTQKQSAVRSTFSAISQAWRGLTSEERSAWNSAVSDYPYQNKLGETKQLSGFALHQKLNLNLAAVGANLIDAPLAPAVVAGLEDLSASIDVGAADEMILSTSALAADANTEYVVFATPSVSAGVTNVNKLFRQIATATGAELLADFDVQSAYTAEFGTPSEGETVGFKCRPVNVNTGQNGAEVKTLTTVVSS